MNASDLTVDDFNKYLKIYNADIDWKPQLEQLFVQTRAQARDIDMAKKIAREQAAFAILYPTHDKYALTDPPHKILFWAKSHPELGSRDWLEDFFKIIKKDQEIKQIREELISMGTVDPIFYVPRWRQAFMRMTDAAAASGVEFSTALSAKYEVLVKYYGGTLINSVFEPQWKKQVEKIHNWRTPYFMEHMIHKVHKKQDMLKIRSLDIQEIQGQDSTRIINVKLSTDLNTNTSGTSF